MTIITVLCSWRPPAQVCALSVSARYACVIDALTGNILFEKNAHERHSMASTTKIMTALVALENGKLSDVVKVSSNAAGTEGSSIYLKSGEEITLEHLLYGLMLASGNDAAIAIAEHIGGNVTNFAKMMTEKAKSLGLKNTSFKNPNGLDAEGQLSPKLRLKMKSLKKLFQPKQKIFQMATKAICAHFQTITNF